MPRRAPAVRNVLLDRDGTVIVERHYLSDPEGVVLIPGAGEALARLAAAGIGLYLVTNQSGIGRGYYGEDAFHAVQERLFALLAPFGVTIADTVFCPHAPADACSCRKPGTGLFEALRQRHRLDPATTAMIGDNASDVAFGLACRLTPTILVLTGHGLEFARKLGLPELSGPAQALPPGHPGWPDTLARDLPAAIDYLLSQAISGEAS